MNLTHTSLKQIILYEVAKTLDSTSNNVTSIMDAVHFFSRIDFKPEIERRLANKIIHDCPLLQTNKIIKQLGTGQHGIVFLLDNHHVFKLFSSAVDGVKKEIAQYNKMRDAQFLGTSNITELPVYDIGFVKFSSRHIPDLAYVEMGKVVPLGDWFTMTQRKKKYAKTHNTVLDFVKQFVSLTNPFIPYMRKKSKDPTLNTKLHKRIHKLFVEFAPKLRAAGMTNQEVTGYFKAVLILVKTFGLNKLYDIHAENFGVNIANPSQIVIYDF